MGIPQELTEKNIWVNWRLTPDKDGSKDRKIPFSPVTGKAAKSNDSSTWGSYRQAIDALDRYGYSGIGFMFTLEDGYVGVDIDNCYDEETNTFNEVAKAIMSHQPTYMEMSPSGKGIHILYKGIKPHGSCKNQAIGVEMYDSARYFTVTGKQIQGSPDTIAEGTETLIWIHDTYFKKVRSGKAKKSHKRASRLPGEELSDDEVLEKAKAAKDDGLFYDLYEGRWEGRYGSQSEADMALALKLAFWTGKNGEQIDRIFRSSKLYREKWDQVHRSDGTTYGQETITKAIEMTEDVYTPGTSNPILEFEGQYYRVKDEKFYPLTNFVISPVEMIVSDQDSEMTVDFVTKTGRYRRRMMSTDFNSAQRFKGMLNKNTIALAYFGADSDLENLKLYLADMTWVTKHGVRAVGIYQHEGQQVFVNGDTAVDKTGRVVEDILQLECWREIKTDILNAELLTVERFKNLGYWLMSYNEPSKTISILAWVAGCFIKEHLRLKGLKYPMLFMIGEAGSGKSTTMEKVLMTIFSETTVQAASQMTKFTLLKLSASSSLMPLFLDEFKPSKMDKTRKEQLNNHFRDIYDMHDGSRGNIDMSVQSYKLLAPMVVAGEESADETAIRERSIELLFSKKDLNNRNFRDGFMYISDHSDWLRELGKTLLMTALSIDADTVLKWHRECIDYFDQNMPERVRSNLRGTYCGLKLLEELCRSLVVSWDDVFPYSFSESVKYIEYGVKDYLLDGGTHNKSIIDQTFEIMSRMRLSSSSDYSISGDMKYLYICFPRVYDEYTKYRRDYAIQGEVLTYNEFRRQLKHSDIYVKNNISQRMGERVQKVWVVRFDILQRRSDVEGFLQNTDIQPLV